jgi:hypothetical protein
VRNEAESAPRTQTRERKCLVATKFPTRRRAARETKRAARE